MKKLLLLTCMLFAVTFAKASVAKSTTPLKVISTADNAVYFKVSKEMVGAVLEVYSEDGTKLLTDKVVNRLVLIDFHFEKPGTYYIKVVSSSAQQLFEFTKFDPAAYSALTEEQSIYVRQGTEIF